LLGQTSQQATVDTFQVSEKNEVFEQNKWSYFYQRKH